MSKIRMKNVLAGALSAAMIFGAAGCAVRESDGEKIDEFRTQLYVFNYGGGFGSDWVKALKTSFEALHAEDVYEEGKKGVQVMIDSKKQSFTAADIKSSLYDVFFTESVNYYNLVGASDGASALLDVTDALKKPLSDLDADDTQSVLDKFYDEQLAYYGVDRGDGNLRYYGVPHYAGYWGIIYNVDLFENRGYYFLDDQSDFEESGMLEDRFINTNAPVKQKRSAGPDGEYNTSDDGLPATYEEFFALCDYIVTDKVLPLRWTGANYKDYLNTFAYTLAVDFEGKENIMRNYTLSGTANNLGTATDGGFSKDGETTEINAGNGYELARGEGWYHAASFLRNLCLNDNVHNNYHNHNAFNGGYSHMTAQQDFLYGGKDGGKTEEAAMLIDGVWWQMEADQTFKDMVNFYGEDCSAQNRKFGYMPLPKATKAKAEETKNSDVKQTLYDAQYAFSFVKSNVEEYKKGLAVEFLRYANTQESLVQYTEITNTTKALNYKLSETEKSKLSYFGRSVIEMQEKSEVVYPYAKNSLYLNNASSFRPGMMFKTAVNDKPIYLAETFRENGTSLKDAFNGIYINQKNIWDTLNRG